MGDVYRATDRLSGGPVAIKLLHPALARDADRFRREAQLLAELSHPRVVRYVAHGVTQDGRPYLAMEWLEGLDLADRLAQSGLTMSESVTVGKRAAEALGALHERGIVHRDVKPSNLFLVGGEILDLKLLDLGIARLTSPTRPATRSGIMVGTPGYMAPEQARGAKELDGRADVFSLGCVLFECITGRPPFIGDNIVALLTKILLEEAPRVSEHRRDVPPMLDDLVTRMLSKNPGARPADGMAVARELSQISQISLDQTRRSDIREIRAITGGERRLVSVVMSSPSMAHVEDKAMAMSADTAIASYDLRSVVAPFGAQFETLADGSLVVAVVGRGSATDQAAHAARCALAIRAHLQDTHMVLATGLATVTERNLFGGVIDRAAAMLLQSRRDGEQLGPDGTEQISVLPLPVRLDETTAGLLDVRFEVDGDERGLGLKGLRNHDKDGSSRTLLGKPTPFVGRERELSTLLALFDECVEEPVARAVLVTAPPGIGKSRLLHEFLLKGKEKYGSAEVWLARGDPMSEGSPFSMLAQAIRRACGSADGEPLVVRRQKLRARIGRHLSGEDLARVTEFIGELVGTPFLDEGSVQLRAARQDAMLMGDQMRRAWEDWIAAEATAQPIVLVLEDLHWGDLPSVKLIDGALRNLQELPVMVIAVARPEVNELFPGLWADRGVQEIRLGPLVRSASEKLVRQMLGDAASPEDVARVVDRSAGNAFYLEELIRAVAEGRGASLPETILAMVEARLELVDADGRRVLRAASVFGGVFWRGGVLSLLGGGYRSTDADEWLQELVNREIIMPRRRAKFPGEHEYAFRHGLVREAAYAMLTSEDRMLGHKLAGEWLELAGEGEAVVLAEHFERGGAPERAVEWYGKAAEQALEGNDFDAAMARAESAIACGAVGVQMGSLRHVQASASDWNGDTQGAERFAVEAMDRLARGGGEWFVAAGEVALAARKNGNFDRVRGVAKQLHLLEGRVEAEKASTSSQTHMNVARLIGTARVTSALYLAGDPSAADEMLEVLVRNSQGFREREPSVAGWIHFARAARAMWTGEVEQDCVDTLAAVERFTAAGDLRNACMNRVNAGCGLSCMGVYGEAERELRQALDAGDRMGLRATTLLAKLNLGPTLSRQQRLDEAHTFALEAVAGYRAHGDALWEGIGRVYLGLILRQKEEYDAAINEVSEALVVVKSVPPLFAAALASLAYIHLSRRELHQARTAATEAFRIFKELGGVLEGEALIRLIYAESLKETGEHELAHAAITEARDRLLARASKIENPAWKRAFLNRVFENARTLARAGEWLRNT